MRSEPFDFENAQGQRLSGRLDLPDGAPRAFALFAHCFTCDKTAKAAVHISHALAAAGVGVLRFDFTGLGESEGAFADSGFSANVDDLVAAARHMESNGRPPSLLIGHSLGGTAALAAAGDIAPVKAVVTIGAPSEPAHVLRLLGEGLAAIEAKGEAKVSIGGRPFVLNKRFIDDARMQALPEQIAKLSRALLVLHSPVDQIVGIENASAIFQGARHPKSFVSLDKADHLLTDPDDTEYAAAMIGTWAARYIGSGADRPACAADGGVLVEETRAGKFQVQVSAHGTRFLADEPADVGGLGLGPTPYELLAAGLGACTCMTVRLYADRKGWPLDRVRTSVRHEKIADQTPPDTFRRLIALEGALDAEQRAKLFEIADKCPVHRTLEGGSRVTTAAFDPAKVPEPSDAATAKAAEDEHFHDMDAACRQA